MGYVLTTDGMLLNSDHLAHYGIKGQEWGNRRWQYEDGTLTPEGRIRYRRGSKLASVYRKDAEKARRKYEKAVANETIYGRTDKKLDRKRKEYEWAKNRSDNFEKQMQEAFGTIEELQNKYLNKNSAEVQTGQDEIDEFTESERAISDIQNRFKGALSTNAEDTWNDYDYGSEEAKKRLSDAADLGLEALHNMGAGFEAYSDEDEDSADLNTKREWFLFEDQTVGKATIADYINQGHSAEETKKLIDEIDNLSSKDYRVLKSGLNEQERAALEDIFNGNKLEKFAEECEKVKASKDPEYLKKIQTSDGDTRYFYDKSELKAYKDGRSGASDKDLDKALKAMKRTAKTGEENDRRESAWERARDEDKWDIDFIEEVQNSVAMEKGDIKTLLTEYAYYLSDPEKYSENREKYLKDY